MTDLEKAAVSPETNQTLLKWVEPEVRTLDIKETAIFPGVGLDGGHVTPDCTRS